MYIGKLVSPKKPISENDNDEAHLDEASDKIITFSHADEKHRFLVDQTLKKGSGLTFDVFQDKVDEEGNPVQNEDPQHVLIKEVVREPRIHFF